MEAVGGGGGVGVGVGVAATPDSLITWPTRIRFAFVIPLMLIRFLEVVPNRDAIPLSESPRTTV